MGSKHYANDMASLLYMYILLQYLYMYNFSAFKVSLTSSYKGV